MEAVNIFDAACLPVLLPVGEVGEKIAIAFIGMSDVTKHAFAAQVMNKRLNCLPMDIANACVTFGRIVCADYLTWCQKGNDLTSWSSPLVGLEIGRSVDISALSEDQFPYMALRLAAMGVFEESKEKTTTPSVPRTTEEKVFLEQVMKSVLKSNPDLQINFQKQFSLHGKRVGNTIDFCGQHYVTSYSAINPKSRGRVRVSSASAALWNLARARDSLGFAAPDTVELTAWVPPEGLPTYSELDYSVVADTVAELSEQARRENLSVFAATDAFTAGKRLVAVEVHSTAIQ